jgi:hypothetical protein
MALPKDKPVRNAGKGKKDAKRGARLGRIRQSKEQRLCGPIGYYLRFGVSKRDALCGGVKPLPKARRLRKS